MKQKEEEIKDKIIEKQEQFLTSDEVLKETGIKKSEMKTDLYSSARTKFLGISKEADINVRRDIKTHRDEYDFSDIVVLFTELVDNGLDALAKRIFVTSRKTPETTKMEFVDDGKGIKSFDKFLELGGDTKEDTTKDTSGFVGQGAKLIITTVATYCIAETKREDGSTSAILFYFNYARNRIVSLKLPPKGRVKTKTGTYIEVNMLNEALDENIPRNSNKYLSNISKYVYSAFLRDNPNSIFVNGKPVVVKDYKDEIDIENEYNFKSRKGKIIVSSRKLPEYPEFGFPLCICKRNIVHLKFSDFGITLPSVIDGRVTGFIWDDKLKTGEVNIVRPNKSDLYKNRKGAKRVWLDFREDIKSEIEYFLEKSGYVEEEEPLVFSEKKDLMNSLNVDLKYAIKNSKLAKNIFSALKESKNGEAVEPVEPNEKDTNPSIPAHTEVRKGKGSVTGVICHASELESFGCNLHTPADKFFKLKKAMFSKNDESVIKVYRYVPGHPLVRLIDDVKVKGAYFTIDNMPLNTQIIIKAYTTYGNPSNQSEPFGRPATFVYLTKDEPTDKVVLPVTVQKGLNVTSSWSPAVPKVGWVEEEDGHKKIFYNSAHPLFRIGKKQGKKSKYLAVLYSVIYAVANFQEPDDTERVSKEILDTIYQRL